MVKIKRLVALILLATIVLTSFSCQKTENKKKQNTEVDLVINANVNVPENINVDFTQYMGTNKKPYKPSEEIFSLKTNRNYAFKNKTNYEFNEYIYIVNGIVFAPASGLCEMFDLEYKTSEDKNTAEISYNDLKVTLTAFADTVNVNGTEFPFITTIKQKDTLLIAAETFAKAIGCNYYYDSYTKISYISTQEEITEDIMANTEKNYELYEKVVYNYEDVKCDQTGVGLFEKSKPEDRLVGIAYSTWHRMTATWDSGTWSTPLIGRYASNKREAIAQHGKWLADADVDFVFVDWSNNTGYVPETMSKLRPDFRMIEEATDILFEEWAKIPNAPKICIFVGPGHNGPDSVKNGSHQKKVNQVYRDYIENEKNKDMYFYYEGKPLLMCYGATPTQYGEIPSWNDDRFTIRWVTGFVGQQPSLFDKETLQSYKYWSWEERGAQTYTVNNGVVEAVTCSAATRSQGKPGGSGYIPESGRKDGATFKKQFQRAMDLGAKIVLIVSWNEWNKGEQPSEEISKDIEPSKAHGTFYYDLMEEQIKKFKGKK